MKLILVRKGSRPNLVYYQRIYLDRLSKPTNKLQTAGFKAEI